MQNQLKTSSSKACSRFNQPHPPKRPMTGEAGPAQTKGPSSPENSGEHDFFCAWLWSWCPVRTAHGFSDTPPAARNRVCWCRVQKRHPTMLPSTMPSTMQSRIRCPNDLLPPIQIGGNWGRKRMSQTAHGWTPQRVRLPENQVRATASTGHNHRAA